jgi:hypothetical protein
MGELPKSCTVITTTDITSCIQHLKAVQQNNSTPCAGREIYGFHGGDYEEWRLLKCYAV